MTRTIYQFTFTKRAPFAAVEDALVLAAVAATAVERHPRGAFTLDVRARTCEIDARTAAGAALLRVFHAYVVGMFGVGSFRVATTADLARRDGRPRRSRSRRTCSCRPEGVRR